MKELMKQREEARAQLTAALGKGARVANAAAFVSKPAAERNLAAFVKKIQERDAAAGAAKTAAKAVEKKVEVVKKEAKNLATTAKKNAKAAATASKAAAKAASKTKSKTRKVIYHKFKYDSVERQARTLAKQAEELQAKLTSVGVELKDVCKMCKDFQDATPV